MNNHERKTGPGGLLLLPLMALGALGLLAPLHWSGIFIDEHSRLRLLSVKVFARVEVRLLAVFYWMLHQGFMDIAWVRKVLYWSMAKFAGERMVVAQAMTLEEMLEFMEGLPDDSTIALGPCRCRLATHACDHPMETDIFILTGAPIWLKAFPRDFRVITMEHAQRLVRECYDIGLVPMLDRHMYFRGSTNYFVICNCCGCACLPILAYRGFKREGYHFIPSTRVSVVDLEKCEGCATCVEVCAFKEREMRGGKAYVLDCQGCGQCVRSCPAQANRMVAR
jgi:ferredoxin